MFKLQFLPFQLTPIQLHHNHSRNKHHMLLQHMNYSKSRNKPHHNQSQIRQTQIGLKYLIQERQNAPYYPYKPAPSCLRVVAIIISLIISKRQQQNLLEYLFISMVLHYNRSSKQQCIRSFRRKEMRRGHTHPRY